MGERMMETPREAARRFAMPMLERGFRPERLYEYTDRTGEVLYHKIRLHHPDTAEKWIRPMRKTGDRYELGEPRFPGGKPLYRLHELFGRPEEMVWYVEGEKCADELAKLGRLATTSGSATSDEWADYTPLAKRMVTIWPDADPAGIQHGERVASRLRALGAKVEMIDAGALGLKEGGDCVDWLHSHPAAVPEDLATLPRAVVSADDRSTGVELISAADLRPEAVDWIWPGWLAARKLHIIAGAPEAGKTSIALSLAAIVARGGRWPDGAQATAGGVVVWSGEDSIPDTLLPRLAALGADLSRVRFVGRVRKQGDAFDPARDMRELGVALEGTDVRLLIVDPIVSAVAGDSHENAKVRRDLQRVVDLAEAVSCAVLGISHFSKGTAGRDPVERVTGSVAFGALPRLVFAAAKLPEEEGGGRIFVRAKSNIGPSGGGFAYRLEPCQIDGNIATCKVVWGDPLEGNARCLLAEVEGIHGDHQGSIAEARGFLRDLLAEGPLPAKAVRSDAVGAGFEWRTVQEAANRLGVDRRKLGMREGWSWALPKMHEAPKMQEDASPETLHLHAPSADRAPSITASDEPSIGEQERF